MSTFFALFEYFLVNQIIFILFISVSVMALDEFSSLKVKFDIEKKCREKAEDYAAEVLFKVSLIH